MIRVARYEARVSGKRSYLADIRLRLPNGERYRRRVTGFPNRTAAREWGRAHEQEIIRRGVPKPNPHSVTSYAATWVADRKALGLVTAVDDEQRLRDHVLPRIGSLPLSEVRASHIRALVLDLRREGKLAPRTIRKVYGTVSTMFRTAIAEELLASTPCILQRGVLPKNADKNPEWRTTAVYTREEVERLVSDPEIPEDRRVLYALKGLAGMRHSEGAKLLWRQVDRERQPLGCLSLGRTKSGVPRDIPIHPTLAKILAAWKLSGWARTYGRALKPDDLVVPSRTMEARTYEDAQHALVADLDALGLRRRRGHDLRRTFISLGLADGARRDLLECVTHGPRGDIISVYNTPPWPALCDEVRKLRIELREGTVIDAEQAARRERFNRRALARWQTPNDAVSARVGGNTGATGTG